MEEVWHHKYLLTSSFKQNIILQLLKEKVKNKFQSNLLNNDILIWFENYK